MSRKRRQRSTTIRKRIEKKRREEEKQRKKELKASGGRGADVLVRMVVARRVAEGCATELNGLAQRLAEGPIRGWTPHDLAGSDGLGALAERLQAAVAEQAGDPVNVDVLEEAKSTLLDKLGGLEMAAPGLKVEWEAGFNDLLQALSHAQELPEESEDEGDEGDDEGDESEASDDED